MQEGQFSTLVSDKDLATLLKAVFDISPLAYSITTAGENSRYVRVNQSYLELTGMTWEQIRRQDIASAGVVIDNPQRQRRLMLLDTVGSYTGEEATIRRKDGKVLTVLISARRLLVSGHMFDLEAMTDITVRHEAQRAQEERLQIAASTDWLTKLKNRSYFDAVLAGRLQDAARSRNFAIAMLDLNGFKTINDIHGHQVGDQVLVTIAERLSAALTEHDLAARVGGDEFALIMDTDNAIRVCAYSDLAATLTTVFQPIEIGGQFFHVGVAAGLAFAHEAPEAPAELVELADRRMYGAKASGLIIGIQGPLA